jgi:hypothetical protein
MRSDVCNLRFSELIKAAFGLSLTAVNTHLERNFSEILIDVCSWRIKYCILRQRISSSYLVPDLYRNEQIMLCTNIQNCLMTCANLKKMTVHMKVFIQTYIKYAEGREMDMWPRRAVGMLHIHMVLCALSLQKRSTFLRVHVDCMLTALMLKNWVPATSTNGHSTWTGLIPERKM